MEVHSRKLLSLSQSNINRLLLTSASLAPALAPAQNELRLTRSEALAQTQLGGQLSAFNADIVLVLSILLCGLICALAVSIAVRCILRCASQTCNHDSPDSSGNDETRTRSSAPVTRGNEALQVLPSLVYSSKLELTGSGSECTICLSEFKHGVHVRVLPVCHHGFHVRCIDKWLATRCTCPTCRRCLFGVAQQDGSESDPTPVAVVDRVSVEATEEINMQL